MRNFVSFGGHLPTPSMTFSFMSFEHRGALHLQRDLCRLLRPLPAMAQFWVSWWSWSVCSPPLSAWHLQRNSQRMGYTHNRWHSGFYTVASSLASPALLSCSFAICSTPTPASSFMHRSPPSGSTPIPGGPHGHSHILTDLGKGWLIQRQMPQCLDWRDYTRNEFVSRAIIFPINF